MHVSVLNWEDKFTSTSLVSRSPVGNREQRASRSGTESTGQAAVAARCLDEAAAVRRDAYAVAVGLSLTVMQSHGHGSRV
jgi:hypothetical protein